MERSKSCSKPNGSCRWCVLTDRMLVKERGQRPDSVRQVAAALESIRQDRLLGFAPQPDLLLPAIDAG